MAAVAECHALMVTGCVYCSAASAGRILRLRRAQFLEAEAIEFFWIRVEFGIHADGLGGNADCGVGRDDKPVRELVVLCNNALKGDCQRGGLV